MVKPEDFKIFTVLICKECCGTSFGKDLKYGDKPLYDDIWVCNDCGTVAYTNDRLLDDLKRKKEIRDAQRAHRAERKAGVKDAS